MDEAAEVVFKETKNAVNAGMNKGENPCVAKPIIIARLVEVPLPPTLRIWLPEGDKVTSGYARR
jgi:hypothetical protein